MVGVAAGIHTMADRAAATAAYSTTICASINWPACTMSMRVMTKNGRVSTKLKVCTAPD